MSPELFLQPSAPFSSEEDRDQNTSLRESAQRNDIAPTKTRKNRTTMKTNLVNAVSTTPSSIFGDPPSTFLRRGRATLWLSLLLGVALITKAQTPICGTINTATWTTAGNPYIVGCDSTVPSAE